MYKQTKSQVIAHVKKHGTWEGWLAGHKVNEFHVNRGWHLGCSIKLFWDKARGVCVVGEETCEHAPTPEDPFRYAHFPRTFQSMLNNWFYYNACYETGYYPSYYQKERSP